MYRTRRIVKSEDLNGAGNLFGGRVLAWVDEEAAIFAMCQLNNTSVVTKVMSTVNFMAPAKMGDIIQIKSELVSIGRTSITVNCEVQNKTTKQTIILVDSIVFVCVDANGNPMPHGVTMEQAKNRT